MKWAKRKQAVEKDYKQPIDESRAAVLLGLSREQLKLLCDKSGSGALDAKEIPTDRVFTYADLHKLCRLAVRATT